MSTTLATETFRPGDWAKTEFQGEPQWARPYRVVDVVANSRMIVVEGQDNPALKHGGWGAEFFRHATQKEIDAVELKKGDWVVCDRARHFGAERGVVHLADNLRVCNLEPSCRHATPEEWRAAQKTTARGHKLENTEVNEMEPTHGLVDVEDGVIDCGEKSTLEQSGDDGRETLVEKTLEEHEERLNDTNEWAETINQRLATLEAKPFEPDAPLLRCRIPGSEYNSTFILVDDKPDDKGRLGYYRGLNLENNTCQSAVRLWPQTLELVTNQNDGSEAPQTEGDVHERIRFYHDKVAKLSKSKRNIKYLWIISSMVLFFCNLALAAQVLLENGLF